MYSRRLKLLQSMQLKSISWLLPRITPGASMIFQQDLASHRSPPPSTHMNTALAHMLTVINMQINMRDYFTRLARLQDKRDILLHHSIRMVLSLELVPLILLLKFGMWRLRYDLVLCIILFKNIFLGDHAIETCLIMNIFYLQAQAATFKGHVGPVTAMSFSENGYFLAVSTFP